MNEYNYIFLFLIIIGFYIVLAYIYYLYLKSIDEEFEVEYFRNIFSITTKKEWLEKETDKSKTIKIYLNIGRAIYTFIIIVVFAFFLIN